MFCHVLYCFMFGLESGLAVWGTCAAHKGEVQNHSLDTVTDTSCLFFAGKWIPAPGNEKAVRVSLIVVPCELCFRSVWILLN